MGCPGENTFAAYFDLTLPPAETAALFAHLDHCSDCARLLMSASAGLRSLPRARFELRPIDASVYEVGREIARGGMGRIFEAWDRRHHRSVAIKMLLRNEDAAAARFLREIRVASRLEHPAIVPLYEAGIWPNGEPFMAMRLIHGKPLGEVVDAAETLRDRMALLPHVTALTEALAYAHEQQVMHRDLKPSNVLVGGFGETVVIDWGLAKELDSPDDAGESASADDADANLTVAGRAMGTPCYMPPEQARGATVTPRADVYALGALLYYVIAGEPPFVGDSSKDVLAKVLAGPPPSLAVRVPGLAPELLTIVEKAMARDHELRYPTAKAMAEDLRRFTKGGLVLAHQYSVGSLIRRWMWRYRAALVMAAALVIAVGLTAGLSVSRIVRERNRADAVKVLAVEQRNAAEDLVDFMMGRLKTTLESVGRLDALEGAGKEVDTYYRRVSATVDDNDHAALRRRAGALETLATVEEQKQNMGSARAFYAQANELRARARSDDMDARAHLVDNMIRAGRIQIDQGDATGGRESIAAALAIAEALVARDPTSPEWQMIAARAHVGMGAAQVAFGDVKAADAEYRAAVSMAERAAATNRENLAWQRDLARAYFFLAYGVMERDAGEAMRAFENSVEILDRLIAREPENPGLRRELLWSLQMLGRLQSKAGQDTAAVTSLLAARRIAEALGERDPTNVDWQRDRFAVHLHLCEAERKRRGLESARQACRASLVTAERLFEHDRSNLTAGDDLIHVQIALAEVELLARRPGAALAVAKAALAISDHFVADAPPAHEILADRASSLVEIARAELTLRTLDAARDHCREARATLARRDVEFPDFADPASMAEVDALAGDIDRAARPR